MKKLLLSVCIAYPLLAQTATLTLSCPGSVRAGTTFVCSIGLSGGATPAGLEWTLASSTSLGTVVATPATAAVTAQKSVACNAQNTCLVTGINANIIADGALAAVTVAVPVALSGTQLTVNLSAATGASLAGTAIAADTNPPVSVSVLSACDIDGNGQIDSSDVAAEIKGVLALPQTAVDLTADGKLNVVDVQIVINAARGLACAAQ